MKKIDLVIKLFNGKIFGHELGNFMIKLRFLLNQIIQRWSGKSGSFKSIGLKRGDSAIFNYAATQRTLNRASHSFVLLVITQTEWLWCAW